jgi:chemotaxis protein methyltransferase CheR
MRSALSDDAIEPAPPEESFFFRDVALFTQFRQIVLPALLASRAADRALRIWCAACASGQAPYSLAMLLAETDGLPPDWRVELVGTDLSPTLIDKAQAGIYGHFEVQRGLPVRYFAKYFAKTDRGWAIEPELRQRVRFRTLNLLEDFSMLGRFDAIFCRNVLMYLDTAARSDILGRMSRQLNRDGFLFLGGGDTVVGVTNRFVHQPGLYGVYVHANRPAPLARMAGQ